MIRYVIRPHRKIRSLRTRNNNAIWPGVLLRGGVCHSHTTNHGAAFVPMRGLVLFSFYRNTAVQQSAMGSVDMRPKGISRGI